MSFVKVNPDGTHESSDICPFLGDEQIAPIKKNLQMYLTGCQKQTQMFFKNTQFMTDPAFGRGYKDFDKDLYHSWGREAMKEVWRYLSSKKKKKIDGKEWSVGWMGSVWRDTELLGVPTRMCYYSRKCNEKMMEPIKKVEYLIMLVPDDVAHFESE